MSGKSLILIFILFILIGLFLFYNELINQGIKELKLEISNNLQKQDEPSFIKSSNNLPSASLMENHFQNGTSTIKNEKIADFKGPNGDPPSVKGPDGPPPSAQ